MNNLDEDRIIELWWQAKEANKETPADIPYDFAKLIEKEISQLFEVGNKDKVMEAMNNPPHPTKEDVELVLKPKPDEDKSLRKTEVSDALNKQFGTDWERFMFVAKAQLEKAETLIRQEERARAVRIIEHYEATRMSPEDWQTLKDEILK